MVFGEPYSTIKLNPLLTPSKGLEPPSDFSYNGFQDRPLTNQSNSANAASRTRTCTRLLAQLLSRQPSCQFEYGCKTRQDAVFQMIGDIKSAKQPYFTNNKNSKILLFEKLQFACLKSPAGESNPRFAVLETALLAVRGPGDIVYLSTSLQDIPIQF